MKQDIEDRIENYMETVGDGVSLICKIFGIIFSFLVSIIVVIFSIPFYLIGLCVKHDNHSQK